VAVRPTYFELPAPSTWRPIVKCRRLVLDAFSSGASRSSTPAAIRAARKAQATRCRAIVQADDFEAVPARERA